ncbi:hypothetical protein THRCLA_01270 [Thraustotheca clavata]|uniref:FHA domain-containing protein n=1 Tax=Thraustotheca clavata TaxID=74557 RepID=A0A1W0A946_9STRA|nr:hypothetical protein THRCLA_01270 [Thraustotheca clavata]
MTRSVAPSLLLTTPAMQSALFEPCIEGITIGTSPLNRFCVPGDLEVDLHHATLEHTKVHGIWVFVDHSTRGSLDRDCTRFHRHATVVNDGDTFVVGNTEIQVHFYDQVADKAGSHRAVSIDTHQYAIPQKPVRRIIAPEYTNSPVPKHKRANSRSSEFSFDAVEFDTVDNQVPLEYSASPQPAAGRFLQTKPIASKRDDLRIQVSKKMANLNTKPSIVPTPSSPLATRPARTINIDHRDHISGFHTEISNAHYPSQRQGNSLFTLDLPKSPAVPILPPKSSYHLFQGIEDENHPENEVYSSVESNAPTEIAKYRDSMESLSSFEDEPNESIVYPQIKPNTPPPRDESNEDDSLHQRLISSLRLKRLQPKPPTIDPVLSPYKTAKSLKQDPLQFYMESPRETSSYFDYSLH